jgi:hypothetical protein
MKGLREKGGKGAIHRYFAAGISIVVSFHFYRPFVHALLGAL